MIFCLIILIIGAIITPIGAVIAYKIRHSWNTALEVISFLMIVLGSCALLASSLLLIIQPIKNKHELSIFISQKEYIESYEPTSEYDSAAILNKKIELNEWLYEKQYNKEHYPIFSFFGDEVLEIEPIK